MASFKFNTSSSFLNNFQLTVSFYCPLSFYSQLQLIAKLLEHDPSSSSPPTRMNVVQVQEALYRTERQLSLALIHPITRLFARDPPKLLRGKRRMEDSVKELRVEFVCMPRSFWRALSMVYFGWCRLAYPQHSKIHRYHLNSSAAGIAVHSTGGISVLHETFDSRLGNKVCSSLCKSVQWTLSWWCQMGDG
jgi:hypothetical protein